MKYSTFKGPGFFAFTKGMLVMLLQNTNTAAGLVNGMTGVPEEVILDKDVPGIRIEVSPVVYLLTLSQLHG